MYTPTINKRYYQEKEKREKRSKAIQLSTEGKTIYEIAKVLDLTEYEVTKMLE